MYAPHHVRQAALSLAVAAAFAFPALAAGDAAHQHAAGGSKLVLNQGKKWPTDAPLRKGMQNIRAALAADLEPIHQDKMTAKRYDALAARVNGEVAAIVQNCKLDKDADAQLHLVIAEILAGAETMQGKEKGIARRTGAERVAGALTQYGRFFAHPGWRNL